MKIMCVPDLHCWYSSPGSEEARIAEYRACTAQIVGDDKRCDIALVPGDLWVSNRPSAQQVMEVAQFLQQLGNPFVIAGNHDVGAQGQINFVDVIHGATKPVCVMEEDSYALALLPFLKGITEDQLLAILHALVAQMVQSGAKYKIVLGHYAIDISTYSSGEFALGKEPVLRMADLQVLPVDAVILGHIHKPGILADGKSGGPIILHTGALTRRDHGEGRDGRGYYIVELIDKSFEYNALPARQFVTYEPLNGDQLWNTNHTLSKAQDAYVRIMLETTQENWKTSEPQKWIDECYEAGAFLVTGVHPHIMDSERSRVEGLSEKTGPMDALRSWLGTRPESEEAKTAALTEAEAMLKEVLV